MQESNIGKLVRTTKDLCEYCNRGHMQIRCIQVVVMVKGEEILEDKKFLLCPNCGDQEAYIDKKENKNKHRELKKVEEVREVRNGGHKERHSAKSGINKTPKRSY